MSNKSGCAAAAHARGVVDTIEVVAPIAFGLLSSEEHGYSCNVLYKSTPVNASPDKSIYR
jgi:hypothetical protein